MDAAANTTEASTMCELCATMIRASAASRPDAQIAVRRAWEAHLRQRHGAELPLLDDSDP